MDAIFSVESLHSFSSPEGDEFAYDVDYDQNAARKPLALAMG